MKSKQSDKNGICRSSLKRGFVALLASSCFILLWTLLVRIVGNEYLLPSVTQILKACGELLKQPSFWTAYASTLSRAYFAFSLSFVVGASLAVVAYVFPKWRNFFAPFVSFLRSLPTMAILLMIILWTSASFAPIVVASTVLLPMTYSFCLSAFTAVDSELVEVSRIYRVPKKRMILRLFLPSIFPSISREGVTALSFSLKLIVSAEITANTFRSIGGEMQAASLYAQIPTVFALTLFVFLTGFAIETLGNAFIRAFERRHL